MGGQAPKTINLALQGGGSHGAFAWGVLDRLLEDGRIDIEAVCATSAGTMNALALGHGLQRGTTRDEGRQLARQTLEDFWSKISAAKYFYGSGENAFWPSISQELSPAWWWFENSIRMLSPYLWNHFDFNPLRHVLEECIDFEELRRCECLQLFISATNVRTGKVRVFEAKELSVDVALASACLPFLFQAVEIEGEHYWDGGFMGNPALFPLFAKSESRDVLIVHINPVTRENVPKRSSEIMNRLNEISFNGSLLKEIRSIAFVKQLIRNGFLTDEAQEHFRDILVHAVRAEAHISDLSGTSKFDTSWTLISKLRERGRAAMDDWLERNYDALGRHDTVDLDKEFSDSVGSIFERFDL